MKKLLIGLIVFCTLAGLFYTKGLPVLVSNAAAINAVENIAKKQMGIDVKIQNPCLKTGLNPQIAFSIDTLNITKNDEILFNLEDFNTLISLEKIFKRKIIVKEFGIDNIFADVDKLMSLASMQNEGQTAQNSSWNIDLFDSILYLNKSFILYSPQKGTLVELSANNLKVDNTQKVERFVHFDLNADIKKNGKTVNVAIKDDNKVVIKNKHIYVNDCPLIINHSKMFFNAQASNDSDFEVEVYAKRFFIPDVIKLIQTDIVENNINDVLMFFDKLNGDFDFNVKLTKDNLVGDIKFNRISAELVPLSNMPFLINSGEIYINGEDLTLKNFKGHYAKKVSNDFDFEGSVKDYLKTIDTKIEMGATLTNDFVKDYLSKAAYIPLELIGKSRAKILIFSKNMEVDVTLMGKIAKGDDILVDGNSLSPTGYDRALKADLHVKGDLLNIETINYYIAKELTKASKGIKPILTLNGNINIPDGKIFDLGFDIPKPLPSEFLNVLIGQKMFKKGEFSGNLHYWDNDSKPKISANLQANGIRIPSQRLFLKNGSITTDNELIKVMAEGRYKRAKYDFSGNIVNSLIFPIIVKNTKLTVDNIDVERIMQTMNAPVQNEQEAQIAYNSATDDEENSDDITQTFDPTNLIIEECIVNIISGKYKNINFGNIQANMSLDKNAVFRLKSNRFDFAEGISSTDVNCDLKNQKYRIKLGVKDVNADLLSTTILNLSKEISGKASGIIDLNTDETLKLNGIIKFVVKDGSIPKIGLVEYVFKFASLFRNPIAMISPSIFSDLVNIPEGNFDKITGDLKLKDNRIELMKIKSSSPQLAAYIVGCYNLENSDAILRIYTKFSNKRKGFAGFLRNISLNSLANKMPLRSRNDSNYYAAELAQIPEIEADENDCQIFLTKVDGDVEHNNFISSLKKIK